MTMTAEDATNQRNHPAISQFLYRWSIERGGRTDDVDSELPQDSQSTKPVSDTLSFVLLIRYVVRAIKKEIQLYQDEDADDDISGNATPAMKSSVRIPSSRASSIEIIQEGYHLLVSCAQQSKSTLVRYEAARAICCYLPTDVVTVVDDKQRTQSAIELGKDPAVLVLQQLMTEEASKPAVQSSCQKILRLIGVDVPLPPARDGQAAEEPNGSRPERSDQPNKAMIV